MTAMRRAGIVARGLAAAVLLAVLVLGVPAALLLTVGNPIPDQWALTSPLTTQALLGVLACVAWVFWAQLAVCVVVETIAELRLITGRSADWLSRVPGTFGGQQTLARMLVQAVIAIGLTAATGTATPWVDHADASTSAQSAEPTAGTNAVRASSKHVPARPVPTASVTVRRGDTLWSIAEQHLGAGERWREIADLNRGRRMAGGSTFDDARTILPGWELRVPSTAPRDAGDAVTVESGDTLWGLAEEAYGEGSEWPRIHEANKARIDDPHWIYPGERFVVPGRGAQDPPDEHRKRVDPPREPDPRTETLPPDEPTPEAAPTPEVHAEDAAAEPAASSEDSGINIDGAAITRALLGGGGFLAAGMLAVYVGRRRTQTRNRRSGMAPPRVTAGLRPDDKALRAVGGEASKRTAFFDSSLRELAQLAEDSGLRLPDASAAHMDHERLYLHLTRPEQAAPAPWSTSDDATTWSVPLTHNPRSLERLSPYPAMVTIGEDAEGVTWLIDLESAGVVQIVGDRSAGEDLARFLAAELALNPWSDAEMVCVAGFAEDVADLNYGRLYPDPRLDIEGLAKQAHQFADALNSSGRDVLWARVTNWEASWAPTIAIGGVSAQELDDLRIAVGELVDEVERASGRTPVALLLVSDEALDSRAVQLRIASPDRVETPWGNLRPNRLTAAEAATLTELFEDAESEGDEPIPVALDADGEPGTTNEAGALVEGLTEPRCGTGDPHSVLPRPDRAYVEAAATTTEDLAVLAPEVPPSEEARALAIDPSLEDDLAEWSEPSSARPKLRVMGPVELHAEGERTKEVESRPAYFAELTAYLAAHPEGVTPGQFATDFAIQNNTLHTRLGQLRKWLGKQPGSDDWYLPNAHRLRGQLVYRIDGLLVDADLFKRLRARGEARGPEGIEDLRRALDLVTGRPYDQQRHHGFGWLVDNPLDHYLTAAIVDVAHIVATYALAEGHPNLALWAAEKAISAAPSEDKPRLDLDRALHAVGDDDEAARYLNREIINRTDDDRAPLDPSDRTKEIAARLRRRGEG